MASNKNASCQSSKQSGQPILQAGTEARWYRVWEWLEHPLTLFAAGLIAGVVGMIWYTPILILCGTLFVFAFYRQSVVAGMRWYVQLLSYLVLVAIVVSGLYLLNRAIKRKLLGQSGQGAQSTSTTAVANPREGEDHQPAPPSRGAALQPKLKLIFKASPVFTAQRRKRITAEVDALYRYLVSIGFDPPKEFPPVGVRTGAVSSRGGWYPGTIYDEQIMLGLDSIDDAPRVRDTFSIYMFEKLLWNHATDKRGGFLLTSGAIFSNYYLADFSNIPPATPRNNAPADKWVSAIWDIRQKHGREFANKALFYAFKQWGVPLDDVEKEDFDAFFGIRFGNGVHVEDNNMQHQKSISSILKAHGIGSSSAMQPTP